MEFLGIDWVGVTAANGRALLVSAAFLAAVLILRAALRRVARGLLPGERGTALHARFWANQAVSIFVTLLGVLGLASIWFETPARLAGIVGLLSAGLAVALQRVITAFAGYVTILGAGVFTVGDRINLGGVRGDVIAVGFLQTTLLEMGETSGGDPGPEVWVRSRQFTGRIVTVSNARVFDDPVYNYTRDFPYIWDELRIPIRYGDDRQAAERILLEAARRHALDPAAVEEAAAEQLLRRFDLRPLDFAPRVYYRLTSNWLELTLRFVFRDHGTRAVKDAIAREVLDRFEATGIAVAASAREIVRLPPVELHAEPRVG